MKGDEKVQFLKLSENEKIDRGFLRGLMARFMNKQV
jgi:hypothetical protein